jgi:pimeloyl-ACP methyl ester carboxylesterase
MKTTYKTLLLTAASLLATSGYAQQRRIDWIHGLGGDQTSWDGTANNYSTARDIPAFTNGQYPTGNGVGAMAVQVGLNTVPALNGTGIAIGHSMGGVVARQLNLWNDARWAGIITLGAPLRGARIVNAVRDGEAQALINNATNQLLRGLRAGSTATAVSTANGILIQNTAIMGSAYSNEIAGYVVNFLINKLSLTPPTIADLSPEGAYIQGMTNQNTAKPKIAIWGSESDPLLWRLAGTFMAGDDEKGISAMNTIAGTYMAMADAEFAMSWIVLPLQGYYNYRGNEWGAGRDWVMNTSNDAWANLIGAAYSQTVSGSIPKMICDYNYYYSGCGSSANPTACRAACWVSQPYSYTNYIKTESDGVVPASSQRNDGGAWRGDIVRAFGNINHQEHLRFDRIEPTLTNIFNGNINETFRIAPR